MSMGLIIYPFTGTDRGTFVESVSGRNVLYDSQPDMTGWTKEARDRWTGAMRARRKRLLDKEKKKELIEKKNNDEGKKTASQSINR